MVRNRQRSRNRIIIGAVLSLGLIAASCGKKDDNGTVATNATIGENATTAATTDTQGTVAESPATTAAADTTPATTPAAKPVPGGEITMSGEAEVTNPWTPATMQCDSYCQERARSFFDLRV